MGRRHRGQTDKVRGRREKCVCGCSLALILPTPQPSYKAIPQLWHRNKRQATSEKAHPQGIPKVKVLPLTHFATTASMGRRDRCQWDGGTLGQSGPKRAMPVAYPAPRRMCRTRARACTSLYTQERCACLCVCVRHVRPKRNGGGGVVVTVVSGAMPSGLCSVCKAAGGDSDPRSTIRVTQKRREARKDRQTDP